MKFDKFSADQKNRFSGSDIASLLTSLRSEGYKFSYLLLKNGTSSITWLGDGEALHAQLFLQGLGAAHIQPLPLVVFVQIISSGSGESSDSSIHDRKFPVVFVVDLRSAGENHRAREHGAYLKIVLMSQSSKILFE